MGSASACVSSAIAVSLVRTPTHAFTCVLPCSKPRSSPEAASQMSVWTGTVIPLFHERGDAVTVEGVEVRHRVEAEPEAEAPPARQDVEAIEELPVIVVDLVRRVEVGVVA